MKKLLNTILIFLLIFFISCEKNEPGNGSSNLSYLDEHIPVKEGLIGYYPFNGDTKDYSGNDRHAVATTANYSNDRYNNNSGAIHLNGIDDFITIPNFGSSLESDEGTIIIWSKAEPSSIPYEQTKSVILSLVDSINTSFLLSTRMGGLEYSYGDYPLLNSGTIESSMSIEGFKLFAFSFTDNSITMYDYIIGEYSFVGTITSPDYSFGFNGYRKNQDLHLGKSIIDTFDSEAFDSYFKCFEGDIDEVLIYDRILTEDEIMLFFNLY